MLFGFIMKHLQNPVLFELVKKQNGTVNGPYPSQIFQKH